MPRLTVEPVPEVTDIFLTQKGREVEKAMALIFIPRLLGIEDELPEDLSNLDDLDEKFLQFWAQLVGCYLWDPLALTPEQQVAMIKNSIPVFWRLHGTPASFNKFGEIMNSSAIDLDSVGHTINPSIRFGPGVIDSPQMREYFTRSIVQLLPYSKTLGTITWVT